MSAFPFEIEVLLSANDLRKANLQLLAQQKLYALIPVTVLFGALIYGYRKEDYLGVGIAFFAVFLMFSVFFYFFHKKAFYKLYKDNPMLQELTYYVFDTEGFEVKNHLSSSTIQWDAIQDFRETKDYILLYLSKIQAFHIPRMVLNADQINGIKASILIEINR